MAEKTKIKLDNVICKFSKENQELFRELTEYIVSLGYNPKVNARETDFIKSKHGKTIMKIETGYGSSPVPRLNIRFDAMPVCIGIFQEAIEHFIERCSRCRKCTGKLGNKYVLPDGRETFPCRAVIYMPFFNADNLSEVKDALKMQDDFLMTHCSK
jgi:hypothetical protein